MEQPTSLTVEIDGQRFEWHPQDWQDLDSVETAPNEFHVLENGRSHWITVLQFDLLSRTCLLKVDGEIKPVRILRDLDMMIERMGLNVTASKKLQFLEAPMPGLVSVIKVSKGDRVEKGTPLLVLEAMKMENVITAAQDATVKSIPVQTGQAVDKGAVLMEFE